MNSFVSASALCCLLNPVARVVAFDIVVGWRSDSLSLRSFVKCLNQFIPAALTTENGFEIVFRRKGRLSNWIAWVGSVFECTYSNTVERGAFCSICGRVAAAGETPAFLVWEVLSILWTSQHLCSFIESRKHVVSEGSEYWSCCASTVANFVGCVY